MKFHPPALTNGTHIWALDTSVMHRLCGEAPERMLSSDERKRTACFKSMRKRMAYLLTRCSLRVLLGEYLDMPPEQVRFVYGSFGKPALGGAGQGRLHFSVTHSGGYSLIALSKEQELGIDLEKIRKRDMDRLARSVLSEDELAQLERLKAEEKCRTFFATWCEREALLKATGIGSGLALVRALFRQAGLSAPDKDGLQRHVGGRTIQHMSIWPDCQAAVCTAGASEHFMVLKPY